ncbi:regulatory protein RecX [Microbacterium sp. ET2]|uniref:regulatory protein RecX n=1 Tax=Microbacterium albipurpureum TaxID=3050384 RepID=UPI00259C9505|nr:regulatory protein RecX [Microbacterium sp. ET2 (Ac-2212)]WJL95294.1 regulatory protein RecX [Microbacterium sp. ET2 (Ac-2212)]
MVRFVESGGEGDLAPVIPLFTGSTPDASPAHPSGGRAARGRSAEAQARSDRAGHPSSRRRGGSTAHVQKEAGTDTEELAVDPATVERALLRRLGARGLSVREAEAFVVARGLSREAAAELVATFCERGYLDDGRLAEQVVWSGVARKSEGRRAIARRLAQRGVERDVADAALAELPDDDDERALEFARGKARSLARLDHDVALRRLAGQLARRGFGGSSALAAARTALQEAHEGD